MGDKQANPKPLFADNILWSELHKQMPGKLTFHLVNYVIKLIQIKISYIWPTGNEVTKIRNFLNDDTFVNIL